MSPTKRYQKNLLIILLLTLICLIINLPKSVTLPWSHLKIGNFSLDHRPDLKYGLDLAGGASLTYQIDTSTILETNLPAALDALKANIEKRVNLFGLSEANIQTSSTPDAHRLIIELPGIDNLDQAIGLIGQTAQLNFKGEADIPLEATSTATFADVFSVDTGINGSHLLRSSVQINPTTSQPEVLLEFNQEGSQLFQQATQKFLNQRIAIFLDQFPVTFPTVQSVITDGKAVINGNFDSKSAKSLSAQLNAGALPLSIKLIQQQHIGATLGLESINQGIKAGIVGLIIVCFFMIGNYGRLGLIATLGLFIYGLITLSLYRLIPVTLTFPGIVGFILSVGMAVDSNILIFERTREEIRHGKNKNMALELGFGRAWDSIKDSNTCTIITALILFNPLDWSFLNSSGIVRGFAATLLLGILVGLFTGVFVTRNLLRVFSQKLESQNI